jgi:hypothetical protein
VKTPDLYYSAAMLDLRAGPPDDEDDDGDENDDEII